MHKELIPLLLITPILLSTLGFLFSRRADFFGLVFGVLFFIETLFLLYGTKEGSLGAYSFGAWQTPLGIAFEPLAFGSTILALSAFIMLLVFIYARFSLSQNQRALFYPLSTLLALGFVVVYLSRDIFTIYIGLEIISLSAVGLATLTNTKRALKASLLYLMSTLVASGFYLLGVAIIYAKYTLLDISALSLVIQNDLTTLVAFGFMVVAFLLKSAVFPLSFWLVDAHANAHASVSALLSALVIKATLYLLYLLSTTLFLFGQNYFLSFFGVAALFYGGVLAYLSSDIKRLIAYSTLSQVGYLLLLFSFVETHSEMALYAMAFALFSHALAKSALFLAAGAIAHLAGTKEIAHLQGYASITPVSVFAIALGALSLIGLPPSLGFVSKWYYLTLAYESGSWFFLFVILASGLLTALYLFRLLILFLQKPLEVQTRGVRNSHFAVLEWVAFLLSFCSLFLAFFSNTIIGFLS